MHINAYPLTLQLPCGLNNFIHVPLNFKIHEHQDEISLKEWHISLRTAYRVSQELVQRMGYFLQVIE